MDGANKRQSSLEENGNRRITHAQNEEKTAGIWWTHNEERRLWKPNPRVAYGSKRHKGTNELLTWWDYMNEGGEALSKGIKTAYKHMG